MSFDQKPKAAVQSQDFELASKQPPVRASSPYCDPENPSNMSNKVMAKQMRQFMNLSQASIPDSSQENSSSQANQSHIMVKKTSMPISSSQSNASQNLNQAEVRKNQNA